MNLGRTMAIAAKEVLHVRRDPRTLALALIVPVALILLFGYAISFDMDELPLAFVDQDRNAESQLFIRDFTASNEVIEAARPPSVAEAMALLRAGEVSGVVVVPVGFAAYGEAPQVLVDGSDGTVATSLIGKVDAIAAVLRAKRPPATQLALLSVFNPGGRSAWFIVPGLAAYVVALVAVLLTALTVAREFEQGSMQQLFATPVARAEIIVGKLLPYLGLGALSVFLVLFVGFTVFEVPMRGDATTLVLASLLFLTGMLGQGLLISTITANQMVATQVATISSMLPSMLLSGFIFPIQNMPLLLQWLTYAVPARYYIGVLRGVLLRGNGLVVLWPQCVALAVFSTVMIATSVARFRREVD